MGKHFSKGKLCQLELTASPKRGESRAWRAPSHIHPSHHLLASVSARGQRGTAVRPGQGQVPAHLHVPTPHPRLPALKDRLHNPHHVLLLLLLQHSPLEAIAAILGSMHSTLQTGRRVASSEPKKKGCTAVLSQ